LQAAAESIKAASDYEAAQSGQKKLLQNNLKAIVNSLTPLNVLQHPQDAGLVYGRFGGRACMVREAPADTTMVKYSLDIL
jgi:hypothetical protein